MLAKRLVELVGDRSLRALAKCGAPFCHSNRVGWISGGSHYESDTENEIDTINEEMNELFGAKHVAKVSQNTSHPFDQKNPMDASAPFRGPISESRIPSISERDKELPGKAALQRNATSAGSQQTQGEDLGMSLTHIDEKGDAVMVDTSDKSDTVREARASATVLLGKDAFLQVKTNTNKKGDVLTVAQISGISAAKQTANLIPLCHTLNLRKVDVEFELDEPQFAVRIRTMAKTMGQTGVEMEALTAASVAALTVYDMCKAVTKSIIISDIQLDHKSGGKSGDYNRPPR
ncbi:hypothetical protein BSKO_11916 [Bryopsis sp. KO-2023]|nr:hypothetical protein BSKO_11916 [Bryopsis sp. KO-2023]